MTAAPVPPEAVTAASAVLWGLHGTTPPYLPRVAEYVSVESTGAEREAEMAAFRAAGAESNALNDDLVRRALEAAAPLIAAAERTRIAAAAEEAAFTLFRPGLGNGPAHGQSMRVVPLSELRGLIGDPDA